MTPTIGHGLCAGAEWIRTFSSALDRRRFRGFVRVGSIYRRPGHPSTCRPRHTIELSQGGPRSRHSPRGLGGVGGASASRNRRFDPSLSSAESANYRLIAQRATRGGTCGPPWAIRGPAVATHCQSRPKPRGGSMQASSSRSRSTMACNVSPVAPSRNASGSASSHAAYSACSLRGVATAARHCCGRLARRPRRAARRCRVVVLGRSCPPKLVQPNRFRTRRRGREVDATGDQREAEVPSPTCPWHVDPPLDESTPIEHLAHGCDGEIEKKQVARCTALGAKHAFHFHPEPDCLLRGRDRDCRTRLRQTRFRCRDPPLRAF